MIIVTGGAGFIGSNIVRRLNQRGDGNVLVVDNLENTEKVKNLADLKITDYMDKSEFYQHMKTRENFPGVRAVFHQGACSDTMATDGKYVLHNNFTYSKELLAFCERHNASYFYASSASVYGSGENFIEEPENESALNAYAWSKLLFDCHVRSLTNISVQCVGLRYFNVYGPGEFHKGRMASVAWHFRNQFKGNGVVKLFGGSAGYGDGEQLRDFVFVDDVVDVNMYLLDNPNVNGIFNVGTGNCQSFNDVALAVVNYHRKLQNAKTINLQQAVEQGFVEYISMPAALLGRYQSYTQADLGKLRQAGYQGAFSSVEQGVSQYMADLEN